MDEYIKREAAKRAVDEAVELSASEYDMICDYLDRIPAADVAPVVHCRHCRSYNKPRLGWCSVHLDREGPDDFCSYGVRMDGDSDAAD